MTTAGSRAVLSIVCLPIVELIASGSAYAEADVSSEVTPPYRLEAAYTGDILNNARGGLRTGGAYLDNIDLALAVDGRSLWNIPGLTLYAHAIRTNSATFSDRYVGDAMTVSSIDTAGALRLYEAWVEWSLGPSSRHSVRSGLYDLNSEFDTSPSRALFMNSAQGMGHDLAQSGQNGPSSFPVTSLGTRWAWMPLRPLRLQAVVLDGVPGDTTDSQGTRVSLDRSDGALVATEVNWSKGRIETLALGHWRYTAEFDDLVATTSSGDPVRRRSNMGTYAAIDARIAGGGLQDEGSVSAFARAGIANGRINAFDRYVGVGLVRRGLSPERLIEEYGIALGAAHTSHPYRLGNANSGTRTDSLEINAELTGRMPVSDWLTLQPDIQYVINPGADSTMRNALVLGLRFEAAWSRER